MDGKKESTPPAECTKDRPYGEQRSGRGDDDDQKNRGRSARSRNGGKDYGRHRMSPPRSPRGWQGRNDIKRRRSRSRSPDDYYYHKRPRVNSHFEPYPGGPMSPPDRYSRPEYGPPMFDRPPSPFNHPMSDRPGPFDRPVSPYSRPSYDPPPYDMYNRRPYDRPPMERLYHSAHDRRPMDCSPFDHPTGDRPGFDRPPYMHPPLDRHPYEGPVVDPRSHPSPPLPRRVPSATVTNRTMETTQRKWQAETHNHTASSLDYPENGPNRVGDSDFSDELSLLRADGMDVVNGNGQMTNKLPFQQNNETRYMASQPMSVGNWSDMALSVTGRGRGFGARGNSAGGRSTNRGTRGRGVTVGASNTPRGRGRGANNHITRGATARQGTNVHTNNSGNRGGKFVARVKARPTQQFQPVQNKVHSLANIKQPDATNMSLAEKLHRFGLFLRNETLKENSIQTVENALTACKLNLKSHYEACELLKYAGRPMFTGCLYIGGQFIIRAVGATKKELKHDVYTQALSVMTTNSVVEILGKRDQGLGVIREELMESLRSSHQESTAAAAAAKDNGLSTNAADSQDLGIKSAFLPLVNLMKTKPVIADNKISVLEQSISMSHCGLKTDFTCEEGKLLNGKRTFRVLLKLGDVLISEGRGMKKKDAKHAAYSNAVKALTTRTVDDLAKGENVEGSQPDEQWTLLENSKAQPSSHKAMKKSIKDVQLNLAEGFNLEKQFTKLVDGLKDSSFKMNNVNSIDCLAVQLALSPVCYYRKVEIVEDISTMIACDLYINNIYLGSGESNTKKEAQIEAYHKAWDLLTTTSPSILLTQQPRKLVSDPPDPNVFDKVVKGSGKYGDSNLERLNRLKIDAYENWKTLNDLIIMEHSDWVGDRERHAFCILNQSATFSGLLMEWAFTGMQGGIYECSINLQNEQVGYGKASTKQGARSQASQMAMNRFYRTQPIIQIVRRDDAKLWLSWEDFQEQAIDFIPPEGFMDGISLQNSASTDSGNDLNQKVVRYGTYLIEQQLHTDNMEDVIFGPGITGPECRAITHQALRLKMKVDVNQYGGQSYLIISRRTTPDVMVECLKQNDGKSGKYVLLTEEERPVLAVAGTPGNHNDPSDNDNADDLPDEGGNNQPSDQNAS